jgi:hypothetical protein
MSKFTQYAVAASDMALADAALLHEASAEDREATGVCLGSGIGNLEDMYNTSVAHHDGVGNSIQPISKHMDSGAKGDELDSTLFLLNRRLPEQRRPSRKSHPYASTLVH